jgi:tetratricopeptide (TPR) repeat protein
VRKSFHLLLLLMALAAALPPPTARAETLTEKNLKEIVVREREIFAKAKSEGENLDAARFQAEVQSLVTSYDVLIQKNPDFAPGYVTYGLLLSRVGMAKQAAAILFQANKLDPGIAVVKNQLAKLLAEDGKPLEALPWIMAAIDLEPKEPLYHYQLGTLLHEARDDFLRAGSFTRPALDGAMIEGFRRAAELAPDNTAFAYRHAEAFYDLETPQWDEALKTWAALEERTAPGVEQQTIRLHAANVLLKKGDPVRAEALLATVDAPELAKQKQTLLDQLAKPREK